MCGRGILPVNSTTPVEEFQKIRSGVEEKTGTVEDIKMDAPYFFKFDADGAVIRDAEAATDAMGHAAVAAASDPKDTAAQLAAADEASATHVDFHADTFADLCNRRRNNLRPLDSAVKLGRLQEAPADGCRRRVQVPPRRNSRRTGRVHLQG